MWKRAIRHLLSVVIGVAIGTAMSQVALRQMRPSFYHEYHQIAEEIYAKYSTDGKLPGPMALSSSARKTLSENKGIQYSAADGLTFRYDKPYPMNTPFLGFLTFGCCWGGAQTCVAERETPEAIAHNAKLRAGTLQTCPMQ